MTRADYNLRTWILAVLGFAAVWHLDQGVQAIRSMKPTVNLIEKPVEVKVVQVPAPRLTGLLPEVR